MAKSISTYGLYDATFTRMMTGTLQKQENWMGKLPSNKSTSGTNKFKKVGFKKIGGSKNNGY